jgi:hypothetical protein
MHSRLVFARSFLDVVSLLSFSLPYARAHTLSNVFQIMLERFGRENPGFDFSNAEFNGAAPDPTSFMGGVDHNAL